MDSVFSALATAGASKEDLCKALATIRINEVLVQALRELRGSNCEERRVLSSDWAVLMDLNKRLAK
jgi:hypothetical protein